MGGRAMFGTGERGRCGTCRWWTRDSAGTYAWANYPETAAQTEQWGECDRQNHPGALMMGQGDGMEVDSHHLETHERFGCVLWEPHDTEGDG